MKVRTERIVAFNRKNILDAADKLFTQNGVEKTTLDMLAAEACCSKPTLYSYFKDKNEVFYALVLDFLQKIAGQVNAVIARNMPFEDTFFELCGQTFQLAARCPIYFEGLIGKINVDIANPDTPKIYNEIYDCGNELTKTLIGLVQAGKKAGYIGNSLNDSAVVFYVWSSLSGIIRMTIQKKDYLGILRLNETDFCRLCFERLLSSCK